MQQPRDRPALALLHLGGQQRLKLADLGLTLAVTASARWANWPPMVGGPLAWSGEQRVLVLVGEIWQRPVVAGERADIVRLRACLCNPASVSK
jgi:hypothetical protein